VVRGSSPLVIGVLSGLSGCGEPYHAPEFATPSFVLPGQHATLTCEECHGPPPFGSIPWGEAQCNGCHEADRKPDPAVPPDPNYHYYPQSCGTSGCHLDTDEGWDAVVGNVNHDFLPLEGVHAIDCTLCHESATPSNADVFPVGGNRYSCASCHDSLDPLGQLDRPPNHYVEPGTGLPYGAVLGWDCNACHDSYTRRGAPIGGWDGAGLHGLIRFAHGTENKDFTVAPPTYAVVDPAAWIGDCASCHPVEPPQYTCTQTCHGEIFVEPVLAFHNGFTPGANDATCTVNGCHVYADIRTAESGIGIGTLP
jgi:hypothetical protein